MPSDVPVYANFKVTQTYECKNRVTKSNIRMQRVIFEIGNKYSAGYYVTCDTHLVTKPFVNKKSDALLSVRKPWSFCEKCNEVFLDHDFTCPVCCGAGELAGDYGMFSCGRCQGRGVL